MHKIRYKFFALLLCISLGISGFTFALPPNNLFDNAKTLPYVPETSEDAVSLYINAIIKKDFYVMDDQQNALIDTIGKWRLYDIIKKLQKPTLIIQGKNDHQVYADKYYNIYKKQLFGASYVSMNLHDDLNHIFMPSKATNLIKALDEYNKPNNIPDEVFLNVSNWILSQ